jgi:hypothetical protein
MKIVQTAGGHPGGEAWKTTPDGSHVRPSDGLLKYRIKKSNCQDLDFPISISPNFVFASNLCLLLFVLVRVIRGKIL